MYDVVALNISLDVRKRLHLILLHANKGIDQPAYPHNPISTFVISLLENILIKLATCKCSIFWQVSVIEQAGLI